MRKLDNRFVSWFYDFSYHFELAKRAALKLISKFNNKSCIISKKKMRNLNEFSNNSFTTIYLLTPFDVNFNIFLRHAQENFIILTLAHKTYCRIAFCCINYNLKIPCCSSLRSPPLSCTIFACRCLRFHAMGSRFSGHSSSCHALSRVKRLKNLFCCALKQRNEKFWLTCLISFVSVHIRKIVEKYFPAFTDNENYFSVFAVGVLNNFIL